MKIENERKIRMKYFVQQKKVISILDSNAGLIMLVNIGGEIGD